MLGISIGGNSCKFAMRDGGEVRLVSARMPENMVRDGEVASPETMAKFLKEVREDEGLRDRNCALVITSSQVFFRHVTLPPMTIAELTLNLPYEFRDFISDDPSEYVYDYAVDEMIKDDEGKLVQMELFAAAASKAAVEGYTTMLRKAGFKLQMITPAPMAYSRLLHQHAERHPGLADKDHVLVDIGHSTIVVSLFRGLRYDSSRTIDFGCSDIDRIIADLKGIDPYTACTYKYNNFEGVLDDPACLDVCFRMAMEISKVINFYNFNNPEREIESLYYLGGGACIPQVTNAIDEMVAVPATSIEKLLPREARGKQGSVTAALALAGMLEGEAM